jgi:hypothetical protein
LSPAKVSIVIAYLPQAYCIITEYSVVLKIVVYRFSHVASHIHANIASCLEWCCTGCSSLGLRRNTSDTELRQLKHQLAFLDSFFGIAQLTVAYILRIFLRCNIMYALHLVEMLRHICREFCCDVVVYVLCILLHCKGLYALHLLLVLRLICSAFCLYVMACMLCIFL